MTVSVPRADLYAYAVRKLTEEVGAFRQALADHATTEDVPAPTADPLVEALARDDGTFVVPEDQKPETNVPALPTEIIDGILGRLAALEGTVPKLSDFEDLRGRVAPLETKTSNFKTLLDGQAELLNIHDNMLSDPSMATLRLKAEDMAKGAASGAATGGDSTQAASG